jgi:hypothetical protein
MFSTGPVLAIGRRLCCPAARDLNGDGFADLAAVDSSGFLVVFANDGLGSLAEMAAYAIAGGARASDGGP